MAMFLSLPVALFPSCSLPLFSSSMSFLHLLCPSLSLFLSSLHVVSPPLPLPFPLSLSDFCHLSSASAYLSPSPSLLLWLVISPHTQPLSPSPFPLILQQKPLLSISSSAFSFSLFPFVLGWEMLFCFPVALFFPMAAPNSKSSGKNLENSCSYYFRGHFRSS